MKLGTMIAFSVALALPAAIRAQEDSREGMSFSQSWDAHGVEFEISGAYERGEVAIFMSLDGENRTNLGPVSLHLGSPVLLAYDRATALGTYELRIAVDTQALANMGLKVYVQAVSVGDEGDRQPDQGLPIRISEPVDIDFGAHADSQGSGADPRNPEDKDQDTDADKDDDR